MNLSLLIPNAKFVYLTPQGRMPLTYLGTYVSDALGYCWKFQSERGFVTLPARHVEEFIWPENEAPDREVNESEMQRAGRVAFHAHRRMTGFQGANGKPLPAWPDLTPTERAGWVAAAMEGHQSYLETKEAIYRKATKPV